MNTLNNLSQEDLALLYKVLCQFWHGLSLYEGPLPPDLKTEEDRAGELMSRIATMMQS